MGTDLVGVDRSRASDNSISDRYPFAHDKALGGVVGGLIRSADASRIGGQRTVPVLAQDGIRPSRVELEGQLLLTQLLLAVRS